MEKKEMWTPSTTRPDAGRRIIAWHSDGDTALLLYVHAKGYTSSGGTAGDWIDGDYDWFWAYLTEGTRLWCEITGAVEFDDESPTLDVSEASPR